ncbi:MAG: class I SAM-dependent DNA methyltransferase [Gemmatimonadota bacterium]
MPERTFDEYAETYDAWFLENRNVLASELLLLRHFLGDSGKTLSVGCGSGLFEERLRTEHGIEIRHGVEPAEGMARIAEKRGLAVERGTAESLPHGAGDFDTVLLNGIPSYVNDLERAFREAHRVLRAGGDIVVVDVPAESSYGLLYRLAALVGTWEDDSLARIAPAHPYPIEFATAAIWRTTEEKADLLREVGFVDLEFAQTLTRHPKFSDDAVEQPIEGFDRGDYVAIRGRKA